MDRRIGAPPRNGRALEPGAGAAPARIQARRRLADRAARWVVAAGGLAVIASILGILGFIVVEVWPLTRRARVAVAPKVETAAPTLVALASDEYRELVAGIAIDGSAVVVRGSDGRVVDRRDVAGGARLVAGGSAAAGGSLLTAATDDGRVLAVPVSWELSFATGTREVSARLGDATWLAVDPAGRPVRLHAVSLHEDGAGLAAAVLDDGSLAVARRETTENLLTGERTETVTVERAKLDVRPTALSVDHRQSRLYLGAAGGELLWWDLRQGLGEPQTASTGTHAVTALSTLIGGRSLVVGSEDGSLAIWMAVRGSGHAAELTRVRDLPSHDGAVIHLAPSQRDKSFLAWSEGGTLALHHSTSGRRLWSGAAAPEGVAALLMTPRADGAFLAHRSAGAEDAPGTAATGATGALTAVAITSPHPETTLRTLFGKVWYEGYDHPALVWQSSGGSDDFEPKLSLTPLLAGTLKGTFYSLLLAIPLGVLGAVYVSQFMHPVHQRVLKPAVEVMAALPTVVLGFLAGLWLAPQLARLLPGLLAAAFLLPPIVVAAVLGLRALPARWLARFPAGTEVFVLALVVAATLALAVRLSAPLELQLFDGDFAVWLERTTGVRYEQRNAVVVGLAMGFAVIPILFSISEEALSNVPRTLVSGSLALGATRWQTVLRVVLPTASPGIFSAVMVAFGRAVGETMIVLMATGNTPIIDWSPWNGFRTLSANIAVEIPEAPVGGTLYRTLFLTALVLFVLTFLVNTAAELVRQRLRERYSRL